MQSRHKTLDRIPNLRYVDGRLPRGEQDDQSHQASGPRRNRSTASAARSSHCTSVQRSRSFFLALDKVQVKYEMLRAHAIDGLSATVSAERHGYSRAAFYLITTAFDQGGMRGLLDEPRGRRGPLKLTAELMEFVATADPTLSGSQLASEVAARFGVTLHRRTIERARR